METFSESLIRLYRSCKCASEHKNFIMFYPLELLLSSVKSCLALCIVDFHARMIKITGIPFSIRNAFKPIDYEKTGPKLENWLATKLYLWHVI